MKEKLALLSDKDKATVLYNSIPELKKRQAALREIARKTEDAMLKQQIEERIWYEEETIRRFRENNGGKFVYVVYEYIKDLNDDYTCGFFWDCEAAIGYGKKKAIEHRFEVHKQEIVRGNDLPRQSIEWRTNPNLCPELAAEEKNSTKEYDGSPIGIMRYEDGELTYIFTHEMTLEEQDKVDEFQTSRFESRFVELKPYPFERGDLVRYTVTGEIGIIQTGKEEYLHWVNKYRERTYLDYIDSSVQVEFLDKSGRHHEHLHPIFLEPALQEEITENTKQQQNMRELANLVSEERQVLHILEKYSKALDLLDEYDHQTMTKPGGLPAVGQLSYEECRSVISQMRFGAESELFGREKDDSFRGSIGNIYQAFDGKDLYPSVEEKAAHLLYFITKNHSFYDGNKRIAAMMFLYFLHKNGILFNGERKLLENETLVALTIMIALSKPEEMEMMITIVMNCLNHSAM